MKTALIFVYVWPEPRSSAAGVRTWELAENLRSFGYAVIALSPCKENAASAELNAAGFPTLACPANDSSVDDLLATYPADLVVYDRFVMEEQFGWKARMLWPDALHIIDTQDLHTVRRAREKLSQSGKDESAVLKLDSADFSPDIEREMGALYRADACLVVSAWEKNWLVQQGYPEDRVHYLPFAAALEKNIPEFSARRGFAFLGNFRHAPNLDAVLLLRDLIWPNLRKELPEEKLYLYGSYPSQQVSELHRKNGIEVHPFVEMHREALKKHRALLAPLRFGAGIKGKVLEAWACGTPVVGTAVALEGLSETSVVLEKFVVRAKEIHESESEWKKYQGQGFASLNPFEPSLLRVSFRDFLLLAEEKRTIWRAQLIGRMLRHFHHNSTKYFSQWIEAKNKK